MNNKIENFKLETLKNSKFVRPVRIKYLQNNKEKSWEAVKSFSSVAILLYHEEKDSFLLVKQFRAPVYLNDFSKVYTYELCAGIVDKDKPLEIIAKEEINEECGYDVPLEKIKRLTSFYTNVGVSGSLQTLYFAKIDESMKVHSGGGINDEEIELEYLPIKDYKNFIFDESKAKTPGLMFAFMWFMENKDKTQ